MRIMVTNHIKAPHQNKLEALVVHFAKNTPLHLGKKKLAKLMYFVDFTAYELQKKSVTGETYKKYHYGPMPVRFYDILSDMQKRGLIECDGQKKEYVPASVKAKVEPDYSGFSPQEMDIITTITEKYRLATAKELESQAQSEPPYKMVEFNEKIPYHLAFYRNSFGEMEIDDDNSTMRFYGLTLKEA